MTKPVSGFSKKSKQEKIAWLLETYFDNSPAAKKVLRQYWNQDQKLQDLHDDFTENTISNYYLPFGIAPNFQINGKLYAIPMVIEESSVVAAASNAAKFWLDRGGFKAEVISTKKTGQVHLQYGGDPEILEDFFREVQAKLLDSIAGIQRNMVERGGGLIDIKLIDSTSQLAEHYQLHCTFETLDAMGANFINSCLEEIASTFSQEASLYSAFDKENSPKVVMSILSNYVPECLVRAHVSCPVSALGEGKIAGEVFARDFVRAVDIARTEIRRAVTHNKGIMNGIDAVVIASGNDFRAVEAAVHAYAARNGRYQGLTWARVEDGQFSFGIELPMALGTVGGLTRLHPMVQFALQLLHQPDARQLMQIVAVAGLAQNFGALRSLVTTGIQKGHMKMHLMNVLNQLNASQDEKSKAVHHFKDQKISHKAVVDFVESLRK
jgi:hydroxymethylglutaryl-CoA reductase